MKVTAQRHRPLKDRDVVLGATERIISPTSDCRATQGQTKAWSPPPSSSRASACTREAHRVRGPTKAPLTSKRGDRR